MHPFWNLLHVPFLFYAIPWVVTWQRIDVSAMWDVWRFIYWGQSLLGKGKDFSLSPIKRINLQTHPKTSLVGLDLSSAVSTLTSKSTHAIRAMAASLAFTSQMDIDGILRNCSLKNHTTFSEFYLKDMSPKCGWSNICLPSFPCCSAVRYLWNRFPPFVLTVREVSINKWLTYRNLTRPTLLHSMLSWHGFMWRKLESQHCPTEGTPVTC